MLVRLFRSMLSSRPVPSQAPTTTPTPEQARLLQEALSALAGADIARIAASLKAIREAGPPSAALHRTLGSELGRSGRLELARGELERAVTLDPSHAGAWSDLGNVQRLSGAIAAAERSYRRALALDPSMSAVSVALAAVESEMGNTDAAIERLRSLIAADGDPAAVESLAQLLDRLQRAQEAKALCCEVIARDSSHGAAHASLGCILLKRDYRSDEALAHFDQALAAGYRTEQLYSNRGIALQDLGRLDDAIASYDDALRLAPEFPLARFHRALALLMRGEFGRAWPDYEMRLVSADQPSAPRQLPIWNGASTDQRLLVYGEQGIGDEIMFASCLPDLLRCCPHLTLACTPKLAGLFERSFPAIEVITLEQARDPSANLAAAPRLGVPIGSLPLYFRRERADFPPHSGYLRADPSLIDEYRDRLAALGPGAKIGISWRGGMDRTRRSLRSLTLPDLAPILDLPGIRVVNLQYDSRTDEAHLASEIASGRIVHWQDALDDYDRTAALVASLDVVVSVCTAVIHLAGALGKPTLILAPFSPEWRYGIAGPGMPWYPSVRIERQSTPGQWQPVIEAIRQEVLARSGGHLERSHSSCC